MFDESNVIKRQITKHLPVPFDKDDEEREELIQSIMENTKLVAEKEIQMLPIKGEKKAAQEAIERACTQLVNGKFEDVEVEQVLDYEDGHVTETRLDTKEVILTREMTEHDHQTDTFDTTTENTEDGDD